MRVRFKPYDYNIDQVADQFHDLRDLLMVMLLQRRDVELLNLAAADRDENVEAAIRETVRDLEPWGEAQRNSRLRATRTTGQYVGQLRRDCNERIQVRAIHMDSPMEVLLAVSVGAGLALGIFHKAIDARERWGQSKARLASWQANEAEARVHAKIAQLIEAELSTNGLSAPTLRSKAMQSVIRNVGAVVNEIDKLEIEQ